MKELIKIYSHPRSGTHFLEAFLAKNFYPNLDLSSKNDIYFGHWSKKILLEGGEPYHDLFGSHFFPQDSKLSHKMIYIYRDGRDVIASIWNSKFYHEDWKGNISFSEFLRKDIDWYGGLGQKKNPKINIVQHWYKHTNDWMKLENENLLKISFEELKANPDIVYQKICKKFFYGRYLKNCLLKKKVDRINKKVGISPNKAKINSWEELFSDDDLDFFFKQLPDKKYLYHN